MNKYDMLWYLFNKKEPYNLETLKIEFCKIDELSMEKLVEVLS